MPGPEARHLPPRRYEELPVDGDGSPAIRTQGRSPGDDTSVEGVADLVTSIATVGLIHPIVVHFPDVDGGPVVVTGERRLRAFRHGCREFPDNPHFSSGNIPAFVFDGPVGEETLRNSQFVENLARLDLRPNEMGRALLLERAALVVDRLTEAGHPPPPEVTSADDPAERWESLKQWRSEAGAANIGADWPEVIDALGVSISPDKAALLVRAYRTLPDDLGSEMDAEEISLHSRQRFAQLFSGREEAAAALWERAQETGRTDLLTKAVAEMAEDDELSPAEALDRAAAANEAANKSRSEALSGPAPSAKLDDPGAHAEPDEDDFEDFEGDEGDGGGFDVGPLIAEIERAVEAFRAGQEPARFKAGSLRLAVRDLVAELGA